MKDCIKIGYIGLGRRGTGVLEYCFADMKDVEIRTLCDLDSAKSEAANKILTDKGRPLAKITTDYHDILTDPEIDAVIIMTAWNSRIKLAIESMRAGKYTAMEVGCAYDISECYELVQAYEETGIPVMMLENCCYGRREMMALRMVREGLFGEIIQCNGGYHHYLNDVELFLKKEDGSVDTSHYRITDYLKRNCEQYPTHELGPISKILNINRGNRMLTLSSFATKSRGLETYMRDHVDPSHPYYNARFCQGDIVTTVITCAGGEQIRLTLDTTLPLPFYSREFTVRGTKGMCEESCASQTTFYLEGMPENVFGNEEEFFEKYDHPLHAEYIKDGSRGGHSGMDWLVVRAFIESVKHGTQTPIDVYDTAAWLAIAPLSEMSIARGGAPVDVPDFTKGKWFCREEPAHVKYSLDVICEDPATPIIPE